MDSIVCKTVGCADFVDCLSLDRHNTVSHIHIHRGSTQKGNQTDSSYKEGMATFGFCSLEKQQRGKV